VTSWKVVLLLEFKGPMNGQELGMAVRTKMEISRVRVPLLALVVLLATLTGCAVLDTKMTPLPVGVDATQPLSAQAVIWGGDDPWHDVYFVKVDGKHMPSRNLAGYPLSLVLPPGQHTIKLLLQAQGNKFLYHEETISVQGGHTYVWSFEDLGSSATLKLIDHGSAQCHLEPSRHGAMQVHQIVCDPNNGDEPH
jgi:hypothetical protein